MKSRLGYHQLQSTFTILISLLMGLKTCESAGNVLWWLISVPLPARHSMRPQTVFLPQYYGVWMIRAWVLALGKLGSQSPSQSCQWIFNDLVADKSCPSAVSDGYLDETFSPTSFSRTAKQSEHGGAGRSRRTSPVYTSPLPHSTVDNNTHDGVRAAVNTPAILLNDKSNEGGKLKILSMKINRSLIY